MLDATSPIPVFDHSQPMSAGVNAMLRSLDSVPHNPTIEKIVEIICDKTSNRDRSFFRVVAAYFFAKMAASMRATLKKSFVRFSRLRQSTLKHCC